MSKTPRNFLSQSEFLKAAEAVKAMREDIEAGKYTQPLLSEFLTHKLGFTVSLGNIKGLLEACEITPPRRGTSQETDRLLELYVELEKRVAKLEAGTKAAHNGS